ncbi:hypothetical protein HCH_00836 [Hahella chejuensis KCTC 2396]|uniref:Uncharacterized protein n=1 Tax=Hahella chejuensis (strain KCTC 2396) TaxID=349521 RepID=Q2SNP5_HAHCH|nr:hypothetical protein HCH_00836 [Hahella chejuensis KCTC 2396]
MKKQQLKRVVQRKKAIEYLCLFRMMGLIDEKSQR